MRTAFGGGGPWAPRTLVDVFEPADRDDVVTVDEQYAAVRRFYGSGPGS